MNIDELIKLIPSSVANLQRLSYLKNNTKSTRIAVFGTYNHGKSTLLNALVGAEIFKAADKRETKEIKEHESRGVIWVDTPGLGADTAEKDDRIAKEAAFKIADFIFIVHNVQAGELDKYEKNLYNLLMRQDKNYKKKLFLVLSQIDQLDQENLEKVKTSIKDQIPDLAQYPVSAIRYLKGKQEGKQKLIDLSGIPEMLSFVDKLKIDVQTFRKKEIQRLGSKAMAELNEIKGHHKKQLDKLQYERSMKITDFSIDFKQIKNAIKHKMEVN
jgi:GTPase